MQSLAAAALSGLSEMNNEAPKMKLLATPKYSDLFGAGCTTSEIKNLSGGVKDDSVALILHSSGITTPCLQV
jgi:hypothetical protein